MKKTTTLTFDTDIPEQAIVYEYLRKQGRKKTKVITNLVLPQAQKEDMLLAAKEELIKAILEDDRIKDLMQGSANSNSRKKASNSEKKIANKKPKPRQIPPQEPEPDISEDIDKDMLMNGLQAFGIL